MLDDHQRSALADAADERDGNHCFSPAHASRRLIEQDHVGATGNGDAYFERALFGIRQKSSRQVAAALQAFSPAKMAGLKVLMGFDADGDGKVTVAEVKVGLDGLLTQRAKVDLAKPVQAVKDPAEPV